MRPSSEGEWEEFYLTERVGGWVTLRALGEGRGAAPGRCGRQRWWSRRKIRDIKC